MEAQRAPGVLTTKYAPRDIKPLPMSPTQRNANRPAILAQTTFPADVITTQFPIACLYSFSPKDLTSFAPRSPFLSR